MSWGRITYVRIGFVDEGVELLHGFPNAYRPKDAGLAGEGDEVRPSRGMRRQKIVQVLIRHG